MDISSDDFLNDRFETFINLKSLDKYFEDEEIVCAHDVYSISNENEAIFTILSDDELINIKITINNPTTQNPLSFKTPTRIKNISGRKIVSNKTSSFLLTRDGLLYKFKSSRSLDNQNVTPSVIYLECFCFEDDKSCFVMISEENRKIILQLYDQFFAAGDYACSRREVPLILAEDQITSLENDLSAARITQDYVFASEVLTDITNNESQMEFFNLFLNIDAKAERVNDIVLLSVNDRLLYIKYRESFERTASEAMMVEGDEKISIEPVLISKGKIKSIKFCNNSLMIIDNFWMLTIYFFCSAARIIKKKEMPLIGDVNCFRFTENYLIYSNDRNIVFMKFQNPPPHEPEIFEIDLKMIITFTVVGKFLLAVDRNHFFYYVPIRRPIFIHDRARGRNEYEDVTDGDIIQFPQVIKYLQSVEGEFKTLTDEVETESNLDLLLDHLLLHRDKFIGGSAEIKFLPSLPNKPAINDIICNPTNSRSGHTYIQITITLAALLKPFTFNIAFYRHTKNHGTLVRHIDIKEKKKTKFAIFVPAEREDDPKNSMELFVHFNFNSINDRHVLQFPMTITKVEENALYQSVIRTEMDGCLKILTDLMKQNNV